MGMIETALAEFDEPRAMIASVKAFGSLTVADDGIEKVEDAHKQVKRLRIDIDKRRKELNDGALSYQRAINAKAKELIAEIEPIEGALMAQREEYDAAKLKAKQAKEAARAAVLQDRANRLAQAGCTAGDLHVLSAMTDDDFQLHLAQESAKAAKARAEEAERKEALRLQEEENNRERLRLEKIRQEMAERESENRRRMEAEMAEQKRKAAEELDALRRQQEAERKKLEAEQAEVARQQKEIRDRLEAERKAEQQREENARKAAAEAERLARLEELRPEIEKAQSFAQAVLTDAADELKRLGNPSWRVLAMTKIEEACKAIVRAVEVG
jgi:hypothetical protein